MDPLVRALPPGPLAIIGDIHGEMAALERLLKRLDCTRHLVFLGDLIDRGPDSPAVCRLVRQLCERGQASMVLGNHELNLLRRRHKQGNGWVLGHRDTDFFEGEAREIASAALPTSERRGLLEWLDARPLALERDDLRVIHACWDDALIGQLPQGKSALRIWQEADRAVHEGPKQNALLQAAEAERAAFEGLANPNLKPQRPLPAHTRLLLAEIEHNPIRCLVCGSEEALEPNNFRYLSGKWRTTARSPWWEHYTDEAHVVVGHYWRRRDGKGSEQEPWGKVSPFAWAGPKENVFCLDYSVGYRFRERWMGRSAATGFETGLAAMLWPEKKIIFDDGFEPESP